MKGESEMRKENWRCVVSLKQGEKTRDLIVLYFTSKKPSKREVFNYIYNTGFDLIEVEIVDIKIIRV